MDWALRLYVPLDKTTGLANLHCTWAGVFAAEAVALLRPAWHILLSDTDVAPTALFEVAELVLVFFVTRAP